MKIQKEVIPLVEGRRRLSEARRQTLLAEYAEVANNWRFLNGLRFAILGFVLTPIAALLGVYQYALSHEPELGSMAKAARLAVPLFGVMSSNAIVFLEQRVKMLLSSCHIRAIQLEFDLRIEEGQFAQLWETHRRFLPAVERWTIMALEVMILLVWLYLVAKA